MKTLAIIGSTGSIGTQTLDVVRQFPGHLSITAMAAGDNTEAFNKQIDEFNPKYVNCNNNASITNTNVSFLNLIDMCSLPEVDIVVMATSGLIGLEPTIAALKSGKNVALSNKDPIVVAGDLIKQTEKDSSGNIYPVDSEPSAIWQCIAGSTNVNKLIITGSGGSARDIPIDKLDSLTPEMALKHPNWAMGRKITIDSATMVNKAFEIIESHWLFEMPWENIEAVIHPQSLVHSLVEFDDASIKAQISNPNMHIPIQYALFYPNNVTNPQFTRLDFSKVINMDFYPMDHQRYPAFNIVLEAAKLGGSYPIVVNTADEIAVEQFLQGKIKYTDIPRIIENIVHTHLKTNYRDIQDIHDIIDDTSKKTQELCMSKSL